MSKRGVSMIVLAITILVMAILVSATISFMEDSDVISDSKKAAKDSQLMQIKEILNTAWNNANATMEPSLDKLQAVVNRAVLENNINTSEYNIIVTEDELFVSRDFVAPRINSSSMSYTNTTATVDLVVGKLDKADYPIKVEYYIKKSTKNDEAYSLKNTVTMTAGTQTAYTYVGLDEGVAYNVKVVVRDVNGNIGTTTLNVTTLAPVVEKVALGELLTAENYGDKVKYSVTVDGITYDDWQIYYHNADYVYLVAGSIVDEVSLYQGATVANLTSEEIALYEKFRVGNSPKYTLADTVNGKTSYSSKAVARLIKDYANFANTTTYGTDVVGAIGAPTIELMVAGWKAKGYTPELTITTGTYGYNINGDTYIDIMCDGLYNQGDFDYYLASPSAWGPDALVATGTGWIGDCGIRGSLGVRPVVCLKSSILASVGTGGYDFELEEK